jgi:hypothetical protein
MINIAIVYDYVQWFDVRGTCIDSNMVESLFMCIVTICVSDVFFIVLFVQTII